MVFGFGWWLACVAVDESLVGSASMLEFHDGFEATLVCDMVWRGCNVAGQGTWVDLLAMFTAPSNRASARAVAVVR